ncbi:response regulator transcription factor [Sphingobacterium sp. B29]|uniref:response regulator transcription factor n=1 Tax=Sphingobacterium sp. B29 TaxID=1933220 RepID=UPI0015608947|nr:response regulator transcription factor [Sphingobacterium sp. B29]
MVVLNDYICLTRLIKQAILMKTTSHAIILDDQKIVAFSFALLLKRECGIELVQSFSQGSEFLQFLRAFGKQELFVFLDYYLPNENGLSLLTEIRRINGDAKVIFLTGATAPAVISSILQYRPEAVLSKSCELSEVFACFEAIKKKELYICSEFERILSTYDKKIKTFTPREIEVLQYFSEGYSVAETASRTFLSPHTVVAHRRKMMAKAACQTIGQMLKYAREHNLI